ncbi:MULTISPECIES: hypothetical protein [unclassified Novosphingobium]|uniref:hypothetical protein n=1 Tax=unclassified Novosphingobium TaxID=2644732 RepID=UPI00135A0C1D|nr:MULTISPECIES: hypothetical protein [unclassified Novosphingobium]
MKGHAIAASLMVLCCTGEAEAESVTGPVVLEAFAHCRTLTAAQARADCFDAAARDLEAAVKNKEVTIVSRQDVRTARRSLFGFTLPRIGLFDGDQGDSNSARVAEQSDFKEIETTITSVRGTANGRVELRVAEGDALWTTTDPMPFPPKAGNKVRIRKGTMGNYFIAVEGLRSVRGMRLR